MEYKKLGHNIIVRLDHDEEVCEQLRIVAEDENITLADISGIGSLSLVKAGVFTPLTKEYHENEMYGVFEMISLSGTITTMNGRPYVHAHIAAGDGAGHVFGGHLTRAVVSATAEIVIRCMNGTVERVHSEDEGLNIFDFKAKSTAQKGKAQPAKR